MTALATEQGVNAKLRALADAFCNIAANGTRRIDTPDDAEDEDRDDEDGKIATMLDEDDDEDFDDDDDEDFDDDDEDFDDDDDDDFDDDDDDDEDD